MSVAMTPEFSNLFETIEADLLKQDGCYDKSVLKDYEPYLYLKNLKGQQKIDALWCLLNRARNWYQIILAHTDDDHAYPFYSLNTTILNALMTTRFEFPETFSFKDLFDALNPPEDPNTYAQRPFSAFVSQIEKHIKQHGLSAALKTDIQAILMMPEIAQHLETSIKPRYGADTGKYVKKLYSLLHSENGQSEKITPPYPCGTGIFGSILSAALATLPADAQSHWNALFHYFATAEAGKPSQKFLDRAKPLLDALGTHDFLSQTNQWFTAAIQLPIQVTEHSQTVFDSEYKWNTYEYIEDYSINLLKGWLWASSLVADTHTLNTISHLIEKCFQKVPSVGAIAVGLGNAGIYALASSQGLEGISHLSRLKLKIKQNNTQKLIQQYIEEQAKKRGIKAAQIEEIAVPDYGLINGERIETFNDYQLVLRLTSVGESELQWLKPDGKPQKTTPAFISQNDECNEHYKHLRDIAKHLKQASSAQRDRLDRLYLENLTWQYPDFEIYYLNHGLVSQIARKLIWSLDGQPALYVENQWQDEQGTPVQVTEQTQVKLWHPIDSTAESVLAWRERLEVLQLKQPFKQAYREIYLLTDAEINTRVYSNRMAAHILKQHQFNVLAASRGWAYSLLGCYDDGRNNQIAKKNLPTYQLNAQFWIDELEDDYEHINETGIWLYVATDQVRFCNVDNQAIPLIDIPPLVFSEIMRDVDLFVGVASVGNDPQWQDSGSNRQNYRDYWHSYSFGDLTEVAKTRKSVLERLLPRLKIRDVAKIDGKFLIVQGKRHQYKIHIGSGNILIAPNDRYLCIVPSRGKDKNVDNLFLPFEGDTGLSIVLSKAFLLAADDKITDPTILNQI